MMIDELVNENNRLKQEAAKSVAAIERLTEDRRVMTEQFEDAAKVATQYMDERDALRVKADALRDAAKAWRDEAQVVNYADIQLSDAVDDYDAAAPTPEPEKASDWVDPEANPESARLMKAMSTVCAEDYDPGIPDEMPPAPTDAESNPIEFDGIKDDEPLDRVVTIKRLDRFATVKRLDDHERRLDDADSSANQFAIRIDALERWREDALPARSGMKETVLQAELAIRGITKRLDALVDRLEALEAAPAQPMTVTDEMVRAYCRAAWPGASKRYYTAVSRSVRTGLEAALAASREDT